MKTRLSKLKTIVLEIFSFIGMWVVGVGLFYVIIFMFELKFNYHGNWQDTLGYSILCGFVWAVVVGIILQTDKWKENKIKRIAKAKSAISDAVSTVLNPK